MSATEVVRRISGQLANEHTVTNSYDGRALNGKHLLGGVSNAGPKSKNLNRLGRAISVKAVRHYSRIAKLEDLFKRAWEQGNLQLCFAMYEAAQSRAFGKPHTATDDSSSNSGSDNKLVVAINELNVNTTAPKRKRAPTLDAVASNNVTTSHPSSREEPGTSEK